MRTLGRIVAGVALITFLIGVASFVYTSLGRSEKETAELLCKAYYMKGFDNGTKIMENVAFGVYKTPQEALQAMTNMHNNWKGL